MNKKAEKAQELFFEGYNCSQAVLGAFADDLGLDFDTAMKLSSSFGGGIGRLREVCGAVSGMMMVAGIKFGYSAPETGGVKAEHYKRIQELAEEFKKKNDSIVCRDLLSLRTQKSTSTPSDRTEDYYKTRPCARIVYDAAQIIDDYIRNCEQE